MEKGLFVFSSVLKKYQNEIIYEMLMKNLDYG